MWRAGGRRQQPPERAHRKPQGNGVKKILCTRNIKKTTKQKTKLYALKDRKMYAAIYLNVLTERTCYLSTIRICICGTKLTFSDVGICCVLFSKNLYLENWIFKIYYRQSVKCKMATQAGRKHHLYVRIHNENCILPSKTRLSCSDHFLLSLSN